MIGKTGVGFLVLCLGSAGKLPKVMLFLVKLSLWRRQTLHTNQAMS